MLNLINNKENAVDLIEHTYENAMELHTQIMASAQMAANCLFEMCANFKIMRDQKLYKELGHETFEDYCEHRAGIKSRQVYNYIQVYETYGKDFLQSNAQLGITKLSIISQLPALEAKELIENNEVESMSTREIERLVAENKKLTEQISLFTQQTDKLKSDEDMQDNTEIENLKEQLSTLQKQKENLKSELQSVQKQQKEQEGKQKELSPDELNALKVAAEKQAEQKAKEILKEAETKYKQELEEIENKTAQKYKEQIKTLEQRNQSEQERAIKLEKQLKLSDSTATTFKIYFDAVQDDFNKMFELMQNADNEIKEKLTLATKQLLQTMEQKVSG